MKKEIEQCTKLIELNVASRLLNDPGLASQGFISYVIPKLKKVFFDWESTSVQAILDRAKKDNYDNLFYITDLYDSKSGQVVNLMSEEFIQINPAFIKTSETAKQTDLLKRGGTFLSVEDLKAYGIKRLDANFKKLTLDDGKIIYVQKTWGNK
jgi:hypothetical protein